MSQLWLIRVPNAKAALRVKSRQTKPSGPTSRLDSYTNELKST